MKLSLLGIYFNLISKDISLGYCLPFPLSKIKIIPGIIIFLLNIAEQSIINKRGGIIFSKQLTHDQNMVYKFSNASVNRRVQKEKLSPTMYDHTLSRLIHHIIAYCCVIF